MTFRMFGIPVEIQFGFWITAVLLGWGADGMTRGLLIWVVVVLVSVLVHEFGHALAIRRHGAEPAITLYWLGGLTAWREVLPISRGGRILISLAGPFAGFTLAALVYGVSRFIPSLMDALPAEGHDFVRQMLWVNIGWGIINLIPVLPLDGGHVLEHALGPKRARLTAWISFGVAATVTLYCLTTGDIWIAFIFGMSAFQSLQRARSEPAIAVLGEAARQRAAASGRVELSQETIARLRDARRALDDERFDEAIALAEEVLSGHSEDGSVEAPAKQAAHAALTVIAWAHLLQGHPAEAESAMIAAERIEEVDPALRGVVKLACGDRKQARKALEEARKRGDNRKEVVGPLIQILIEEGEIPRAAAVALDIVESLSDDDARKMAQIAFDGGAFDWSVRLYEAVFSREGQADDAYEAARAAAKDGQDEKALRLLRHAVEAGFSDRARAWSDAALSALQRERGLETVVPRP